jgi:hypothetical protein
VAIQQISLLPIVCPASILSPTIEEQQWKKLNTKNKRLLIPIYFAVRLPPPLLFYGTLEKQS